MQEIATVIQAVASLLMVAVTIALVLLTWRYTEATRRMASVMAQDYESRIAPVIDVRPGSTMYSTEGFTITALISNLGKEPVRIEHFELL